jgi:hypothetical protein
MDLGKSGKGPMNRFDFENEEDYGDYMAKREALPKGKTFSVKSSLKMKFVRWDKVDFAKF